MKRKETLALAIDALQKQYKYNLFASDSDAAKQMRLKIAEAIDVLKEMEHENGKRN